MTNSFRWARSQLAFAPISSGTAMATSVAAVLCTTLLFPFLYLYVDLLSSGGRIPEYAELPASKRAAFRNEFESTDHSGTLTEKVLNKIRVPEAPVPFVWEQRWQASVYATLTNKVHPDAAQQYLAIDIEQEGHVLPTNPSSRSMGMLSIIVRERSHWSSGLLGRFARWNRWTWSGDDSTAIQNSYLMGLFVLGFFFAFARGLFLNVASHAAAIATIAAGVRIRRAVHAHGYRLSAIATRPEARVEAGELVTHQVERIQDGLQAHLTTSIRGPILTLLMMSVILLSGEIFLSISLLLLIAIVWLVAGQAVEWFLEDARRAERRTQARYAMMRESLSMMQLVKAYLMERFSQTRFERHLSDLSSSMWRKQRGDTLSRPALHAVISLVGIVMLYLSGRVVLGGGLSLAGLVVKVAALGTMAFALHRWLAARHRIALARDAAADVSEFLERRGETGQGIDAEFLPPMQKQLEFRGVTLRESGGRTVLEDVSLIVPAKERTAIACSNPREAKAIAHLITRFNDPTSGEVRFDGKNTRWVTFESVRAQTAVIFEESLTFSDTVANNIGCGDSSYTLPQIVDAAKLAHAHQFIQRLPYGYQTPVGDGGVLLRPGQRFRIALARALLRDPSLIIIEEPSEPLDADSIVLIDDTLNRIRGTTTFLFLARRLSTIRGADHVYMIQEGKLVAAGRHDELLQANTDYQALHFKLSATAGAAD